MLLIYNREVIEERWSKQWGGRMNELVFIGQHLDKAQLIKYLEQCLLQDPEQDLSGTKAGLKDPFSQYI